MSISIPDGGSPARPVPDVHLARAGDINAMLSSWQQLLLLTSITIGAGLLPEYERREYQAAIDARLTGCRCRESALGMVAGAALYAAAWTLLPMLRTSVWGDLLAGLGVALLAGAVGRVVGHVLNRRQLRGDLRALQILVSQAGNRSSSL